MDKKYIIGFVIGIIVLLGGMVYLTERSQDPSMDVDLTAFTQCIKDKGAQFYGAFWCPHCQATKKMFGQSKNNLPYIECSTPDGKGQLPICTEKGVNVYPTWFFADGSKMEGELSLQQIASQTSCELPAELAQAPVAETAPTGTSSSSVAQ